MKRILISLTLVFMLIFNDLTADEKASITEPGELFQNTVILNAGHWIYWQSNTHSHRYPPKAMFPEFSKNIISTDGFFWGSWLPGETDSIRVNGKFWRNGLVPGCFNGQPATEKIYRVRPDWKFLPDHAFIEEAQVLFGLPKEAIQPEHIQAIRDDYAYNWKHWPVEYGAPFVDVNQNGEYDPVLDEEGFVDPFLGDYPGIPNAAQTIWYAMNDGDNAKTRQAYKCDPLGIEVQITTWLYNSDSLSDVIFQNFKLTNNSTRDLDSLYFSKIVDFYFDFSSHYYAACDSSLNLGYLFLRNYEAKQADYPFPTMGGLIFPQNPFTKSPAVKMNAFSYVNFGVLNEYCDQYSVFNLLRGYDYFSCNIKNPKRIYHQSGPDSGKATKFPFNGNPVTLSGDVDKWGNIKIIGINHGPFKLKADQSKDITIAILGGTEPTVKEIVASLLNLASNLKQGHLQPYSALMLKQEITPYERETKGMIKFAIPEHLKIQAVKLNWKKDFYTLVAQSEAEKIEQLGKYDVWQSKFTLPNSPTPLNLDLKIQDLTGRWHVINAFLKQVTCRLKPEVVDTELIWENRLQDGAPNLGERIHLKLHIKNRDLTHPISSLRYQAERIKGNLHTPIEPGQIYDGNSLIVDCQMPEEGEIGHAVFNLVFDGNVARYDLPITIKQVFLSPLSGDTLSFKHQSGYAFNCFPIISDPYQITGHKYQIYFTEDTLLHKMYWNLKDLDTQTLKLIQQPLEIASNRDFPVIDGIEWRVFNEDYGVKAVVEVSNGQGPLPPEEWDEKGAPFHGNNVWLDPSAISDEHPFYVYSNWLDLHWRRKPLKIRNDIELRFTDQDTSVYCWWYDENVFAFVPFEAWDVGLGTFDDPGDDIRLLTGGSSGGGTVGVFDFTVNEVLLNRPGSDWIYLRKPLDELGTYQVFYEDVTSGAYTYSWWDHSTGILDRLVIGSYDGSGVLPEAGTVIRFIFNKPFTTEDTLLIDTGVIDSLKTIHTPGQFVLKQNYPNPFNNQTYIPFEIKEDGHYQMEIFSVLGQKIVTLYDGFIPAGKHGLKWQPQNSKGQRLSSGLYICRLKGPHEYKVKKLMLLR